eukprot:gene11754-13789_t
MPSVLELHKKEKHFPARLGTTIAAPSLGAAQEEEPPGGKAGDNTPANGNASCGLQSQAVSPEARRALAALAEKTEKSPASLDGQAIGNAFYGLQSQADSPEARRTPFTLASVLEMQPAEKHFPARLGTTI